MEYLGIDVQKVESQICILTESGEVVERRIRTQRERFAAVLGERPRAKILIEACASYEECGPVTVQPRLRFPRRVRARP